MKGPLKRQYTLHVALKQICYLLKGVVICVLSLAKSKLRQSTWKKKVCTYIRWDQQRVLQASKLPETRKTEKTKSEIWANSSRTRGTRAHTGHFFFN